MLRKTRFVSAVVGGALVLSAALAGSANATGDRHGTTPAEHSARTAIHLIWWEPDFIWWEPDHCAAGKSITL